MISSRFSHTVLAIVTTYSFVACAADGDTSRHDITRMDSNQANFQHPEFLSHEYQHLRFADSLHETGYDEHSYLPSSAEDHSRLEEQSKKVAQHFLESSADVNHEIDEFLKVSNEEKKGAVWKILAAIQRRVFGPFDEENGNSSSGHTEMHPQDPDNGAFDDEHRDDSVVLENEGRDFQTIISTTENGKIGQTQHVPPPHDTTTTHQDEKLVYEEEYLRYEKTITTTTTVHEQSNEPSNTDEMNKKGTEMPNDTFPVETKAAHLNINDDDEDVAEKTNLAQNAFSSGQHHGTSEVVSSFDQSNAEFTRTTSRSRSISSSSSENEPTGEVEPQQSSTFNGIPSVTPIHQQKSENIRNLEQQVNDKSLITGSPENQRNADVEDLHSMEQLNGTNAYFVLEFSLQEFNRILELIPQEYHERIHAVRAEDQTVARQLFNNSSSFQNAPVAQY